MYRWNLGSHAIQRILIVFFLHIIYRGPGTDIPLAMESQITSLNIIRHGVQGDLGLVPNWQQKLNLGGKDTMDFFFSSCAKAANGQGKEGTKKTETVARRIGALARRVCKMVGTVQVWDAFQEKGNVPFSYW